VRLKNIIRTSALTSYPPRKGMAFHPLKPSLRKENPLGATVEEVATLALESTV